MTSDPKCELCSARPAEMVIVRGRADDMVRTLVCRECAGDRARLYANANLDLGGILDRVRATGSQRRPTKGACELCGATLADLVTDGRPGCCVCYSRFQTAVGDMIREAQGRSRHVGKAPRR